MDDDISDISANGYNLTPIATPSFVTGLFGKGRLYERTNSEADHTAASSVPNLNITGSQSWAACIKMASINDMAVVMITESGVGQKGIYINNTTGKPTFIVDNLTTNNFITWDSNLSIDTWYRIVGVYDSANSKLKLWVNGTKKELTASGSALSLSGKLAVGRRDAFTDFYFDGIIDDVAVFNRALTDAEVQNLFCGTPMSSSPSASTSPSASVSPSSSASPSTSPSASISPSSSASRSASPSASSSASTSPSGSQSPSASASPSVSPSASASPSLASPSPSVSPSSSISPSISASPSPSSSISASASPSPTDYEEKYYIKNTIFTDKYSPKNTNYTGKYADRGTSYTDKYSKKSTSFDDKYTPRGNTYQNKYRNSA